jgi:hypothetical protein
MAKVEVIGQKEAEDLLAQLPIELRRTGLTAALRAGAQVVRRSIKQRAPVGDPKHHRSKKPLNQTIGLKVGNYQQQTFYVVVGAEYPAGAHSHLADQGHEIVVSRGPRKGHKLGIRSAKKEFMAPAIDSTRTQARQKTIDKLVDAIKKAGG